MAARDRLGYTPVGGVASMGCAEALDWLLTHGADAAAWKGGGRNALLMRAATRDHADVIAVLLKHGADMEQPDPYGYTALQKAARHGSDAAAKLLLQEGATPDVFSLAAMNDAAGLAELLRKDPARVSMRGPRGEQPLHWAGGAEAAAVLVNGGADMAARDRLGYTPVGGVASMGCAEALDWLLTHGADAAAWKGGGRNALLRRAAMRDHADVIAVLLKHGADMEQPDPYGYTALQNAARHGSDAAAKLLLQEGATPDVFSLAAMNDAAGLAQLLHDAPARAIATGPGGRKPLHWAGGPEAAAVLVEAGADIESEDAAGKRPLHLAAARGRLELLRWLLKKGAAVGSTDEDGHTPLHRAAGILSDRQLETVSVLLAAGADPNASDARGETPLFEASMADRPEVCAKLIKAGARVEQHAWRDGRTVLHVAVAFDHAEVVKVLLAHGVEPDLADQDGATALFYAEAGDSLAAARAIIEGGANVDARAREERKTVLHHACWGVVDSEAQDVARLLLSHGADAAAKNRRGETAAEGDRRMRVFRGRALGGGAGFTSGGADGESEVYEFEPEPVPQLPLIRLLVESGGDVNAQDADGNTPLHYVAGVYPDAVAEVLDTSEE